MRLITSSFKTISILYDFAVDGGAIGTYNTGVFLPAGASVVTSVFTIITGCTSALGIDVLSIGTVNSSVNSLLQTLITPSSNLGYFVIGTSAILNFPVLFTNQLCSLIVADEITFDISGEPLTGGSFIWSLQYQENNI